MEGQQEFSQRDIKKASVDALPHFRELSGINEITPADVEGVSVAVIDNFGTNLVNAETTAGIEIRTSKNPHGDMVKSVLRNVYPKDRINSINIDHTSVSGDVALALLDSPLKIDRALKELDDLPDIQLPDLVNMSNALGWPSMDNVEHDLLRLKDLMIAQAGIAGIPYLKFNIGIYRRNKANEIKKQYEVVKNRIVESIENLRSRGVTFFASVDNYPSQANLKKAKFTLQTVLPGIIAVGGVEARVDGGYARLGNPELAEVTAIGLWDSPNTEPYITGNSFATPMTVIGAGMVLHARPELKAMTPGEREKALVSTLNQATNTLPVKVYRSRDKERPGFVGEEKPTKVLDLRKLKHNLQEV